MSYDSKKGYYPFLFEDVFESSAYSHGVCFFSEGKWKKNILLVFNNGTVSLLKKIYETLLMHRKRLS